MGHIRSSGLEETRTPNGHDDTYLVSAHSSAFPQISLASWLPLCRSTSKISCTIAYILSWKHSPHVTVEMLGLYMWWCAARLCYEKTPYQKLHTGSSYSSACYSVFFFLVSYQVQDFFRLLTETSLIINMPQGCAAYCFFWTLLHANTCHIHHSQFYNGPSSVWYIHSLSQTSHLT
jgi:hypothetical protein